MGLLKEQQTVLIVDDNPINLQVLARLLSENYHVKIANCGLKALEIAENQEVDLILLDILMPEMDGYEVCRRLKCNQGTMDIPLIFVTARDEHIFEEKGFQMGAVDYISKPFHLSIVEARVNTHLRLRKKTKLLEKMAAIDGLTEIPNRRSFDETLEREWLRAMRSGESLALLMLDVDQFKQYNDHVGHAAGDVCLQTVAKILINCLKRKNDFLARYGGEEFAAILPGTDLKGAQAIAETFCNAVESAAITHPKSETSSVVTICVGGVSTIPKMDCCPEEILEIADNMLYKAKNEGRNRAIVIQAQLSETEINNAPKT